jgi:hypothetical protein
MKILVWLRWAAPVVLSAFALQICFAGGEIEIVLPTGIHPSAQFGAQELRDALVRKGLRVVSGGRSTSSQVVLAERGDPVLRDLDVPRPPDAPESYVIAAADPRTIVVEGTDATGVMYGAMDLGEQITWAKDNDFVHQISPKSQTPFLPVRGINMFLTAQGFDDPHSWYWSDAFWEGYLDMMARTRHNFLDFHGPFDITTSWPNGFSYFVYLPEFAEVGVGQERARRDLDQFRHIVQMAGNRGVKVGFMNYSAAATVGPWNTGIWGDTQPFVGRPQQFLTGPRLEAYTYAAVATFLKAVPELWMFGFRVGESGQPEDFYKRTYLRAVQEVPSGLNLYVRTWVADPKKVREMAAECKNHFYIEPKFNGEHLGLPYQAALGGRFYPPSGSFEDYTNYPRDISIIWQIRASGTHRVFAWAWPEFARRTVKTCKLGGGMGFSMEPMNAYSSQTDYLHNNPEIDHNFYHWMYEKQWAWYMIWGRTAYDPEVPDRVWEEEFNRRFGDRAGSTVYHALVESSKIVPLIYSYHNQGLDHTSMAPEFESGDHGPGTRPTIWQGKYRVPYGGDNDDFLATEVLDRTAMANPISYVEARLKAQPTGKMSPFDVAANLRAEAAESERWITQTPGDSALVTKEFDCIRMDINAVAALGRYYADRIESATHLEFYRRTFYHPELSAARESLNRAVVDWDCLADVTDRHFGYVPELVRMRTYKFRWRDEGRSLGVDLEDLNRREEEFLNQSWSTFHWRVLVGHIPAEMVSPGTPLVVKAGLAGAAPDMQLFLFYQSPGADGYVKVPMRLESSLEHTWTGQIPSEAIIPGTLRYYFEALGGVATGYGGTLASRDPYSVRVAGKCDRPVIVHTQPPGPVRGDHVNLTVQVRGGAPIQSVRVHYKRLPAYYEWLSIDMENTGHEEYGAVVPLTSEGILYYFDAVDENGKDVHHPDFRQATPYYVIDAWPDNPGSQERTR